ncbi:MAG: ABC transporter permease [Chitinophagaceae bacterium]
MKFFKLFGEYILLIKGMFTKPENFKMYWKELMHQCVEIGIGSLGIVSIISVFMGAVSAAQTAYQLTNPLIPKSTLAQIVRDTVILEFAPTLVCIVLAGVVGSKIAGELGNMRTTEQIDALEIMGINTKSYLVAPKILAALITIPLLVILAMVLGIYGGRLASTMTNIVSPDVYDKGLQEGFSPFNVFFALAKAYTFAFIISSVPAFYGYNVKGGALEIGRASTTAVVTSCILILFADYILAAILIIMIEIKNVGKAFGDKQILKGVTAVMETGKTNLIIGTSGSGKTVLQKCMVGLFEVDSGEILYHGKSFTSMPEEERKELRQQIGMLFQGSALFDSMTVEQNIKFPLDMFTKWDNKKKIDRVNEVLERVNLKDTNKKYPAEVSGGMKKRVGIARAIVLNPKYLFCDEPNSGLDPQTSLVIDLLIKEITEEYNMTTIINTHDMNSVMEIGQNILYMYQGEKEWIGNNKEIIFSKNEQLNEFIFASEFLRDAKDMRMLEEKGIIDNERNMDDVMKNPETHLLMADNDKREYTSGK